VRLRGILSGLKRDQRGSMAIETAIVAPVLAMMAVGTFEAGSMVSRQQELQSAAAEAETVILAAATGPGADSNEVKDVIEQSLGLAPTADNPEPVKLEQRFRCNDSEELLLDGAGCDPGLPVFQYVLLQVTDTYEPVWTDFFGIGSPVEYNIVRTIQVR